MRLIDQVTEKATLARWLFPAGVLYSSRSSGPQMAIGDWQGNPGDSCIVWLDQGRLFDFNGGRHGDLVDVIMERYGLVNLREARQWLYSQGWLTPGLAPEPPPAPVVELVDLPPAPARTPIPEPKGDGMVHVYRWADGTIPLLVHRLVGQDGRKIIRRQVWDAERGEWYRRWDDEAKRWRWGSSENARLPLYGLLGLLSRPDDTVLIVEGEKTAKAGVILFPQLVTVSPCGGSNPAWGTDWTPLAGRRVYVLGDYDRAGEAFNRKVQYHAREAGAADVLPQDPSRVFRFLGGAGYPPQGWDIADLIGGNGQ